MANLFIHNLLSGLEQDRPANALIAIMEYSDRQVLSEFLTMVVGTKVHIALDNKVKFILPANQNAPNAMIQVPGLLEVVIYASSATHINEDKFRDCWESFQAQKERRVLLALSSAAKQPEIIRELNAKSLNPLFSVRYLSWSHILELVWKLQKELSAEPVTLFLLAQLEEYLKPLSQYSYDGVSFESFIDYGLALKQVADHQRTTQKALDHLLNLISKEIHLKNKDLNLKWRIRKGFAPSQNSVFFNRLFAQSPNLPESAGYCILPYLELPDQLKIGYYFSLWAKPEPDIFEWLKQRQDEIEDKCRNILFFGKYTQDVFHISKELTEEKLTRLLTGDKQSLEWTGEIIAAFFGTMEAYLQQASQELDSPQA